MMRGRFWQGLVWGSLVGTVLGAIIGPMARPQRKPLIERGADTIKDVTSDFVKGARRTRKRFMKRMH